MNLNHTRSWCKEITIIALIFTYVPYKKDLQNKCPWQILHYIVWLIVTFDNNRAFKFGAFTHIKALLHCWFSSWSEPVQHVLALSAYFSWHITAWLQFFNLINCYLKGAHLNDFNADGVVKYKFNCCYLWPRHL